MFGRLPIFPLPIVLFPEAQQALHIFEPRYRQMLADCLAADRRFGVCYIDPETGPNIAPEAGAVGCRANVRTHHRLPDGRSNILTIGEERYALREYLESDRLYLVAHVEYFEDEPVDTTELTTLADQVRDQFTRLISRLSVAKGETPPGTDIPSHPTPLSFYVAAALWIGVRQKQELLQLRSTGQRLRRLTEYLETLHEQIPKHLDVRVLAQGNGRRIRGSTGVVEA